MMPADPSTGVKPDFSIQIPIADSKGGQRTVVLDFLKSATAERLARGSPIRSRQVT